MSTLQEINHDVATMSRSHAGARLLVALGGLLFVASLAAGTAGIADADEANVVLGLAAVIAMVAVAVVSAWHPHTLMPFVAMGFLILNWIVLMPSVWSPWSLPAALALLVMHTSAAVCATVPAQAPIPRELWTLSSHRVTVVAALTVVVWLLAALVDYTSSSTGLGPAFVGLWVLLALFAVHYRTFVAPQRSPQRTTRG